jgi:hypothetical protein
MPQLFWLINDNETILQFYNTQGINGYKLKRFKHKIRYHVPPDKSIVHYNLAKWIRSHYTQTYA